MTKRSMTNEESRLVDAMCSHGCTVCDATEVEFHHLPMARPNALACGYPVCEPGHHRTVNNGKIAVHSSRKDFVREYGTEYSLLQKSILRALKCGVTSLIELELKGGCIVCDADEDIHFFKFSWEDNEEIIGFPLCLTHLAGQSFPGESIHSDRLLFTQKYGTELELLQKALLRVFEDK